MSRKLTTEDYKSTSFLQSFNYAVEGIIYAFRNEVNFRVHMISAILVLAGSLFFDLSKVEMVCLCITVSFVIICELINTAIESVVNLLYKKYDKEAKIAKDVGAGAVLVTAFNSLLVGYLIFFDRISKFSVNVATKIQNSTEHLTFIAIAMVVLFTVILKSVFSKGKGTPFKGGAVSGHSALGFCLAAIISFVANNSIVTLISFAMAILIAESRVGAKIHSLAEVIFGAILGISIATILFKIIV